MPESRVIPTAQAADLPTFTILVDGNVLASAYQVLSLVVEKEINRIAWAKIVLIDGDPSAQDFSISNEDVFVPGKEIEIQAGYHADEETIFKGVVIAQKLKIRADKMQLEVSCKDQAVKLTGLRKSRYFYDSTDSDILENIIADAGLEADVEATDTSYPEMVQYQLSDWDFCVTRAQANGKVCVVDDGKFSVLAPNIGQEEQLTLVFGATILGFDAELDARNQHGKVSALGWDVANQSILEKEAETPEVQLNGDIATDAWDELAAGDTQQLKRGSTVNDAGLQQWANARDLFNQLSKVRGRVQFQGFGSVKPNTTLVLAGVGRRFSGKVYVSAVRHQITDGNWTTDAQFGMNARWFSETVDINEKPAAGLLGAVSGLHVAKVSQIHNDPMGEYRVQVRLPLISNDEDGVWARVATLDAGDGRGSFFRPELDDEVVVGFLNDDPNNPVILGMMHSSALPSPIEASEENNEKGLVTRSGIRSVFNDDKVAATLETPAGKKITIDEDAGVVQLEDENGNLIKLNSDGILLESAHDITINATGDIKLEGMNINNKANGEFAADGAAGAKINSSAIVEINGSLVKIN